MEQVIRTSINLKTHLLHFSSPKYFLGGFFFYIFLNSYKQFLNSEIFLKTKHLTYNRNQLFKIINSHEGICGLTLWDRQHFWYAPSNLNF